MSVPSVVSTSTSPVYNLAYQVYKDPSLVYITSLICSCVLYRVFRLRRTLPKVHDPPKGV